MKRRSYFSHAFLAGLLPTLLIGASCRAPFSIRNDAQTAAQPTEMREHSMVPFPIPADLLSPHGAHANPPLEVVIPPDSPLTISRIELGELLFSDRRLSRDQSMACVDCHRPELSFTSPVVTARLRNPPVIFNRLFSHRQFWNARAGNLEDQIRMTMAEPVEMNLPGPEAVKRLRKDTELVTRFRLAFGTSSIEEEDLYRALASFVRSIISYDSKFDQSQRPNSKIHLTEIEEKGRKLFFEKYKCSVCHSGPNFTNEILSPPCYPQFGQASSRPLQNAQTKTKRRFNLEVKTPSLRELSGSSPYFHNGGLTTIEETIEFYDRSGPPPADFLNAELFQVPINEIGKDEVQQLKAFLGTLNGRIEYGHPRKSVTR